MSEPDGCTCYDETTRKCPIHSSAQDFIKNLCKKQIEDMSPEDRLDFLASLDFCKECGYDHPSYGICQCWNDE